MHVNKKYFLVAGSLITILLGLSLTLAKFSNNSNEVHGLVLQGKTNKNVYILGEPVTLNFKFINEGKSPQTIYSGGVMVGNLKIFIENADGQFREYFASGWGRERAYELTINPNAEFDYPDAVVLWNGKPNVSHLNRAAAEQVTAGKILTEYGFQNSGIYFVKGLSYVGNSGEQIESTPLQIVVNEPVGDDLVVWQKIEGNRDIALLMQTGNFGTSDSAIAEKLVSDVENLITEFPNSTYTSYLKPNLELFKANEQRRKQSLGQK